MVRYLEAFYRHRLLVLAPIIIALVASLGFAVTRAKTYEASAQLWFDASSTTTQAAQLNGYLSPADQAVGELKELLASRSFTSQVGRRGPLADDLLHARPTKDPITWTINLLRGVPSSASASNPQVLDDLLFATVNADTKVTANGPQIVAITFDYSTPLVAAGSAQSVVDQFSDELLGIRLSQAQAQIDFYTGQLQTQQQQVATADNAVEAYLRAHPDQRAATALPDAQLTELRRVDDLAQTHYQDLLTHLDTAKLDIAAARQPGAAGFRIIDAPTTPYRAKGFVKSAALAGAAGLVVGLLLAFVTVLLLTAIDTSVHRAQEMPEELSRRIVGSIPRVG